MLELSCQRDVKKKKASFFYYSEFLALQKSSGEKKLIHKSFGPKKNFTKKREFYFWGLLQTFFFPGKDGLYSTLMIINTQQFGRYSPVECPEAHLPLLPLPWQRWGLLTGLTQRIQLPLHLVLKQIS